MLTLLACGDNEDSDSEVIKELTTLDSVYLSEENAEPAPAFNPELLGNWKLVDMKMGGKSYLNSIGSQQLTFMESGNLVYRTDDLPPKQGDFVQAGDYLSAPGILTEDLKIQKLDATRLVLVDEISLEKVEYVYSRIPE